MIAESPGQRIPPVPAQNGVGYFTQDYAAVFVNEQREFDKIADLQKEAFVDHSTPILIVTLETIHPFGYHRDDFEYLATDWFNRWQIGTKNIDGKNQGILILLVKKERLCRIELGSDWGKTFDDHCQKIMNHGMIPYFKVNDYATGLRKGTEKILEMTKIGTSGNPPSFWPINPAILMFGLIGVAIVVMSIALAWRKKENLGTFILTMIVGGFVIGILWKPLTFGPLFICVVIPCSLLYKCYRVIKGSDERSKSESPKARWIRFKSNITSWSWWVRFILNFYTNLGRSEGYGIGHMDGGIGGFGGGGGGFSGGGFSGGSSGGGGATGSW